LEQRRQNPFGQEDRIRRRQRRFDSIEEGRRNTGGDRDKSWTKQANWKPEDKDKSALALAIKNAKILLGNI
jgi:hypothetical protein